MISKELEATLRGIAMRLRMDYPTERLLLFGSYATGTAHKRSDMDILIFDEPPTDLVRLGNAKERWERCASNQVVDLVLASTAPPSLIERALREGFDLPEPRRAAAGPRDRS